MREILFRGQRLDNGQWEYGGLLQDEGSSTKRSFIAIRFAGDHNVKEYEVKTDSIGQLTSKTYDNGKKIWENDLFEVKKNGTDTHIEYFTCQVVWHTGYAAFVFKVVNGDSPVFFIIFPDPHILSIKYLGNIHDNPELLK